MNQPTREEFDALKLDCVRKGVQGAGELTNNVNAGTGAIKCAVCGSEIPTIMRRAERQKSNS